MAFVLAANTLISGGTVGFYVLFAIGLTAGVLILGNPEWTADSRFGRWLDR